MGVTRDGRINRNGTVVAGSLRGVVTLNRPFSHPSLSHLSTNLVVPHPYMPHTGVPMFSLQRH